MYQAVALVLMLAMTNLETSLGRCRELKLSVAR
jgi:hypothetical protein